MFSQSGSSSRKNEYEIIGILFCVVFVVSLIGYWNHLYYLPVILYVALSLACATVVGMQTTSEQLDKKP